MQCGAGEPVKPVQWMITWTTLPSPIAPHASPCSAVAHLHAGAFPTWSIVQTSTRAIVYASGPASIERVTIGKEDSRWSVNFLFVHPFQDVAPREASYVHPQGLTAPLRLGTGRLRLRLERRRAPRSSPRERAHARAERGGVPRLGTKGLLQGQSRRVLLLRPVRLAEQRRGYGVQDRWGPRRCLRERGLHRWSWSCVGTTRG